MPQNPFPSAEEPNTNGTQKDGAAKPARPRGLLPQALEELQSSVEELRVADEEMRVQNEELSLSRQRLEAERQRYQDLFEFAPDGYLVTSLDGVILEANRAASRLFGISPRFLKKRSLGTLIAIPDLSGFQSRLQSLTGPNPEPFGEWNVQLRRRPSGKFHAAVTAAPYRGLLGAPTTLRWLIRDITDRIAAEEERAALARAEAERDEAAEVYRRTTEILEIVTDTFVALDSEWRIVSLNGSAIRLFENGGLDPNTLLGRVLWEVDPTVQGPEFEAETMRAVAAGQVVEFEAFSGRLHRWFQVRVFPAPGGAALYANDITERKEAEETLKAAYERERRIADTLQRTLLHTPAPDNYPGLRVETFYTAASGEALIGGDFSDVFTFDGGKLALVVGGISGSGLGLATLIAEVKYALRTILREAVPPEAALARLNSFLCEAQHQGDMSAGCQVTLSLTVYDSNTGALIYLTAGGPPLRLLRADGTVEAVGAGGPLLGADGSASYAPSRASLAPGETLLMVTDGPAEIRWDSALSGTLRERGDALRESARQQASGDLPGDFCLLLARRPMS